MAEYLYALIRYVPDAIRMEPINIGVLLQGPDRLDFKLNVHASKRKDFNTIIFRQWRQFLQDEIKGPTLQLFQPRKTSPDFFIYLAGLCEGSVILSTALYHAAPDELPFDDVMNSLYARLVATPESSSHIDSSRPTGRFREISDARNFLARGMKRHAHVTLGGRKLWMAYRQIDNGELIAIEKVEVAQQMGATANEIERLPRIRESLPEFLGNGPRLKPTRCVILADRLERPFGDQTQDEFNSMRDDLEREIDQLEELGAEVIRSPEAAELLGDEVDHKLPVNLPTPVECRPSLS